MGEGGRERERREIDAGEDTHIYIYKGRGREGIERERVYIMGGKMRERVSEREACV